MLEVDLRHFPSKLMKAGSVALIGNGGNLAIAQHMASDITRHTGKFCFAPDSVHTTAVGGDGDWKLSWMQYAKHADLIIGLTCRKHSSTSAAVMDIRHQCDTLLFAPEQHEVLQLALRLSAFFSWCVSITKNEQRVCVSRSRKYMGHVSSE